MGDRQLYELRNPPVMSMVPHRDDLYKIMSERMSKAADDIERLREQNRLLAMDKIELRGRLAAMEPS